MRGTRGDRGYGPPPLENHKLYGFLYRQCRTQRGPECPEQKFTHITTLLKEKVAVGAQTGL